MSMNLTKMTLSFKDLAGEQQAFAGGKGGSLAKLYQANFPVPDGFAILPAAFVDDALTPEAWSHIRSHLNRLRNTYGPITFAVRSSAMSEDSAHASFAGEFETVLNVKADDEIYEAIHRVYNSRLNERVKAYSLAKGLDIAHDIAVIVQQLVLAESSGVLFTANPINGQRDQAMISASWGLGEAIVSGLVNPDTLVVDKMTGRVLNRDTADKLVMTVCGRIGTEEEAVPDKLRRRPVLSDQEAAELVRLGQRIESLFGTPMDIEWTRANKQFAIVQARPITTLPEAEPPTPIEWKLPKGAYVGMRNNIVELMADPLTPLFGTLGLSSVNKSMGNLLMTFFDKPGIMPEELIITVNEYAYYNGSIKPWPMFKIILNSVGILKRMFRGAVERWTEFGRPAYVATIKRWQVQKWRQLPATEILKATRELSEATIDAYGALVSGVIPAAWMSEGLFTLAYKLIKKGEDPSAPTFLMGFDSLPIRAEKSLYDLAEWVRLYPVLATYLNGTPSARLAEELGNEQPPPGIETKNWREWQNRFQMHLQKYGHTIYNLDFANPVPADDPSPLLDTMKLFLSGQGVNPYSRQKTAILRREQATQTMLNRLKGLRLNLFRKSLAWAQRYAPLREDGLADVGLSYPLLRQMLRELGHRFVGAGMINEPDDVFWLKEDEIEQAVEKLDSKEALDDLSEIIPQRKSTWQAGKRISPPLMLPQIKFLGKNIEELKSGRSKRRDREGLKGVAASPGSVTAPACVVHGPEDFAQMKTGDVLVAPITTPAWTPLFARASAIVTDVGGPLSHGSIVAREYGIPAVLGTGTATKRIRDGQVITVNGSNGKVFW
jgi:phosphohistidine swiveling domain-containing protein